MAKRKTPTTSKVTRATTTAPMRVQRKPADTVASEDIARLAYEKFVARGCEHGHDVADWLAAEAELSR
ncbi:MAG: DUF2934 domain-containing protein [Kofleriaceae bacterium]|nr:DUF2934 domain-containing protein [Kofleriaceae bacterium]